MFKLKSIPRYSTVDGSKLTVISPRWYFYSAGKPCIFMLLFIQFFARIIMILLIINVPVTIKMSLRNYKLFILLSKQFTFEVKTL